jgi:hypothetical protein
MLEILNHPAFYPALFGFLGGFFPVWLIFSVRLRFLREASRASQRAAADKLATAASLKSALETEIATLRMNEARLVKHQGELEGRGKSDEQRTRDFARLIKAMQENLETALQAREQTLLEAISRLAVAPPPVPVVASDPGSSSATGPAGVDDFDFVPLENLPGEAEENEQEEQDGSSPRGDCEPSAAKAESAANAFREALKKNLP